jgi:hypothetical protein
VTVRVLDYAGDGTYYLEDPALELERLREGPVGRVLSGPPAPAGRAVRALLGAPSELGPRALDVIVAAPKPVSLLLATEPSATARCVVALHERAVAATFDYLLDDARRRAGSATRELPAVGFTHGVNRLLDPHLHTHVLVAAREADGAPVNGRPLRWRAASADALYLAALREGLPSAAGRAAWLGRSGATLVEGVDLGLVAAMTTPRSRDGRLERGGAKQHPSGEAVRAHWDAQVASGEDLGLVSSPPPRTTAIDEYRFAAALGSGRVGPADVVRAWGAACTFGERPERLRRAAALAAPELRGGSRRPAVVVADAAGVRVLGARPLDLGALADWRAGREALARYLGAGHRLHHLEDLRGASAATRLAIAALDVELAARRLGPDRVRGGLQPGTVARELS